ncbi:TPA: hypothetical protein ACIZC1_002551 [Enterococcus faecalis]
MKKKAVHGESKKFVVGILALAVLSASGGIGIAIHNNEVRAEQTAIEEKQAYKNLQIEADKAVKKAYETRHEEEIQLAERVIEMLKENDQIEPNKKLTQLRSLLKQVKTTEELLTIAEKTKKESDLHAAQKSIDGEKDPYLEKDKKAHQARLDQLKKAISAQKAKEQAEKDKQAKAKAEQEAAQQEQAPVAKQDSGPAQATPEEATPAVASAPNTTPEVGNEGAQANVPSYEVPAPEVPQYQAPAAQTPVAPTPEQPAQSQAPQVQQPTQPVQPPKEWTQEDMDHAEREQTNPREDPNSPWFHK